MPSFQIIKNDPFVDDFKKAEQLAIIQDVAKKIGNILDSKVFHSETIHGHIVRFSLNERAKGVNPIYNILGFDFLANLEKKPIVRRIGLPNEYTIDVYLKR